MTNPDLTPGQQALATALAGLPPHPDDSGQFDYVDMCAELPDSVLQAVAAEIAETGEMVPGGGPIHQPRQDQLLDMIKAAVFAEWDLQMITDRVRRDNQQLQLPL